MEVKRLAQLLKESQHTTVLSGFGMLLESDYPAIRDGEESYDIEQTYGYSAEELFSSAFYSTRQEMFFDFYRNFLLAPASKPPGKCFYELAKLQEKGFAQSIITRRIFGLPERAGCHDVINLHGTIYENKCPRCGREYTMEYIRDSKKVPLCEDCHTPIRPQVSLFGEMVDNYTTSRAVEEVQKADVLLVLGTNLRTYLCSQLINYYQGDKLIIINKEPHFSDKYADIVINEYVGDALEEIIKELGE